MDKIVVESFASYLRKPAQTDASTCKVEWQTLRSAGADLAESLHSISTSELRAVLIDHNVTVHIAEDRIEVKINKDQATITTSAQLVRRGNELRIALPPGGASATGSTSDPSLVRLVVQGFAAREHLLSGIEIPTIADYDKRHLHRLARISWLAPDIITAILDGRQPVQLTARHLSRCADIPLEWQQQRHFLGFS